MIPLSLVDGAFLHARVFVCVCVCAFDCAVMCVCVMFSFAFAASTRVFRVHACLVSGQEYDGSDSGARPDEAVSWGKIKLDAKPVKVGQPKPHEIGRRQTTGNAWKEQYEIKCPLHNHRKTNKYCSSRHNDRTYNRVKICRVLKTKLRRDAHNFTRFLYPSSCKFLILLEAGCRDLSPRFLQGSDNVELANASVPVCPRGNHSLSSRPSDTATCRPSSEMPSVAVMLLVRFTQKLRWCSRSSWHKRSPRISTH